MILVLLIPVTLAPRARSEVFGSISPEFSSFRESLNFASLFSRKLREVLWNLLSGHLFHFHSLAYHMYPKWVKRSKD